MYRDDWQEKMFNARVGIAGAGGLGSNCACALVRAGIGSLVIADFDVVSESNLNRQFFFRDQLGMKKTVALKQNLHRIRPDVVLEMHDIRIDDGNFADLFRNCDVIVEAMDLADEKAAFIEHIMGEFPDKPLVVASGMAGWGAFGELAIEIYDKLYLCGDRAREIGPEMPPLAPRVGIVAHMQANAVMEIIINGKVT